MIAFCTRPSRNIAILYATIPIFIDDIHYKRFIAKEACAAPLNNNTIVIEDVPMREFFYS